MTGLVVFPSSVFLWLCSRIGRNYAECLLVICRTLFSSNMAANTHQSVMCFFLDKWSYFATLCFFWGRQRNISNSGLVGTRSSTPLVGTLMLQTEQLVSFLKPPIPVNYFSVWSNSPIFKCSATVTNRATCIISQITHPSPLFHCVIQFTHLSIQDLICSTVQDLATTEQFFQLFWTLSLIFLR